MSEIKRGPELSFGRRDAERSAPASLRSPFLFRMERQRGSLCWLKNEQRIQMSALKKSKIFFIMNGSKMEARQRVQMMDIQYIRQGE